MLLSEIRALILELKRVLPPAGWEGRTRDWSAISEGMTALVRESDKHTSELIEWVMKQTGIILAECEDCSRWGDEDGTCHVASGSVICESCRGDYFYCENCEELHPENDAHTVHGRIGVERIVCRGCRREGYYRCCRCSEYYPDGAMEDDYCPSCYEDRGEEEDGDSNHIRAHDSDVTARCARKWLSAPNEKTDKHGNGLAKSATLWMGFELEVCTRNGRGRDADAIHALLAGRGILKNDGSLPDSGVEIVSLPATLAYHQTGWDGFLTALPKHARGWGVDACGMHVHIARDALTPLQIARLAVFLNGDGKDVNNSAFIAQVAGRGPTTYCKVVHKRLTDSSPNLERHKHRNVAISGCDCKPCQEIALGFRRAEEAARAMGVTGGQLRTLRASHGGPVSRACYDRRESDRYQALNLQNKATIEIRIFQSNVARLGFLKNLEFCHAIVSFCALSGNGNLTSAGFLAWLDARRGEYPSLTQWAVREGVLNRKHKDQPGKQPALLAA